LWSSILIVKFLSHFWQMFKNLQQKWGINGAQFWVIFVAFGFTGITTALITRYITEWIGLTSESFWLWKTLVRIFMLLFGYQVILLSYGALLGQWAFFWKYEKLLLQKLRIMPSEKANKFPKLVNIAIFASGAGSNAANIIRYFKNRTDIKISLIVCNKPEAGVLDIAQKNGVATLLIEKDRFAKGDAYLPELQKAGIDFVVLAGFLWKVPAALIAGYPNKIINIHPALLPKYGGKGMYGSKVHEAIIAAGEKESGITIHFVNEHYDEGATIFQATCAIDSTDTAETLATKIHDLEYAHFPKQIDELLTIR
jgi:formyltetrahydrofolate-dependent phosphoribosylglycinamide formyltransferase